MFGQVSDEVQIIQLVLTFLGTMVTAWLAYKTAQLQIAANANRENLRDVRDRVIEVKATTDGITRRLVEKAEEKGVEQGRRVEMERNIGLTPPPEAPTGGNPAPPV